MSELFNEPSDYVFHWMMRGKGEDTLCSGSLGHNLHPDLVNALTKIITVHKEILM